MKLGINGYTMEPWPLEKQVTAAAAAGFQGLEVDQSKLRTYLAEHEAVQLAELMADHRIEPTMICYQHLWFDPQGRAERMRAFRGLVSDAASIGASSLCVPGTPNVPPDKSIAELLQLATEEIRIMASIAGERGLSVFLEPIGLRQPILGPRQAMEIIDASGCDNIKVVFDVVHYYANSVTSEEIAATPVGLLGDIHVAGIRDVPRESIHDFVRLYPSLGPLPLAEMLRIPRDQGYDGYVSVEVFCQQYYDTDPDLAKHSMDYLKAALALVPWVLKPL